MKRVVVAVLVAAGAVVTARAIKSRPADPTLTVSNSEQPQAAAERNAGLNDAQRKIVAFLRLRSTTDPRPPHVCLAPDAPIELALALENSIYSPPEYETGNSWSGSQGTPASVTWSFAPDGTSVPDGVGEGAGTSSLFAVMNDDIGAFSVWKGLFQQCFDRWDGLNGITYSFVSINSMNDDGAAFFNSGGNAQRGDCRIAAKTIDGPGGILAYNQFPSGGDMVLDAADFWGGTANNYRFLRNVVTHEHGHGQGLFHVCPANQTKLMEPFISTAYDGPQQDDIRGAQRLYGDNYESNETGATASDLGPVSATLLVQDVSSDDNGDQDYYKFTVGVNKQVRLTVTPVGSTYIAGPQNDGCTSSQSNAALTVSDLGVELLGNNGGTVLASSNSQPSGVPEETTTVIVNPAGGTFHAHVVPGSANDIQRYTLEVKVTDSPAAAGFTITFPDGLPSVLIPNAVTPLNITIVNGASVPVTNSGLLFYSINGGSFFQSPIQFLGGSNYVALLPPVGCFAELGFYVQFASQGSPALGVSPNGAPDDTHNAQAYSSLAVGFSDTFQTDQGWIVGGTSSGDNATAGVWTRVDPVGTTAQPENDSSDAGPLCYVTGQGTVGGAVGAADVDGGQTTLKSPLFPPLAGKDADFSYARWYSNDQGQSPNEDVLLIQITNNGSTWVTVESVTENANAWVTRSFRVGDFVTPTNAVEVRFIASDLGSGSLVEAGVDTFQVSVYECSASTSVNIVSVNPPLDNPFVAGTQPFSDVLDTGTDDSLTRGIGAVGTPTEDSVTYAPITVSFSATIAPTPNLFNIGVTCTGPSPEPCPTINSVVGLGAGPYTITLSSPIPPGDCTTLTFGGTAPGQQVQYQYLPGDLNYNGSVSAADISVLVTALNNGTASLPANRPRFDINRTGTVAAADASRLVQLLNGVNTTDVWAGATVANCP